ncbi:RNA-binding protein Hfq, partial [Bacillus cereus]
MEHLQEELYKQIREEKGTVTIFLKRGDRIVGEVVGVEK